MTDHKKHITKDNFQKKPSLHHKEAFFTPQTRILYNANKDSLQIALIYKSRRCLTCHVPWPERPRLHTSHVHVPLRATHDANQHNTFY